ncbi:hypothetical protein H8M03_08250 [Sphingomonas sabuli]|uniref:Uncharacterized protein n=1 Tax=Sphingomonas sabuli TaxID=2764186 RepID=A0A7G9L075_9SPHN|nr:hypothetical protein [Sphingomonas sabuli]QNM82024.1 hypothetical protein H8M03_08250 [Sphingomonas sabuli]
MRSDCMIALLALIAAAGQAAPASIAEDFRLTNPRAIELFERDPRLMQWAVRAFDANGDGHLSIREADTAAIEFKRIADGDTDGQVTPTEYRSASDFIAARWTSN